MSPEQAKKILAVDKINLARKVSEGRLLTASEREALEKAVESGATHEALPESPTPCPRFAPSQSALGEILDVSRQVVAYHCKRHSSPGRTADGRYPVEAWREYLQSIGRLNVSSRSSGIQRDGRPHIKPDFGDGCHGAIDVVGATILPALTASGCDLPPEAKDKLAFKVWLVLARAIDQRATPWGFPSYFADEPCYPEAINAIAGRITAANSTTNPKPV